ncbi:hypothetical protein HD806DRAFT_520983 [Xylariaceae sp. AK1471]|nr:hypothetical protein HD806DRAFT_520983 [Xylariaceae sp. AK1471]
MATVKKVKAEVDNEALSSTEPRPASSFSKKRGSTNSDPIVLNDEDDDAQERRKPAGKKRHTAATGLSPRAGSNKKWRLSAPTTPAAPADDTSSTITQPRKFAEILQDDQVDEDKSGLQERIAILETALVRAEEQAKDDNEKLKKAQLFIKKQTEDLRKFDDVRRYALTEEQIIGLVAEKLQLLETIKKLETDQKKLEATLASVRLENTKSTETREAVQKALAAERQSMQKQKTSHAETQQALLNAQKQASLDTENLKKAREVALKYQIRLNEATTTLATLRGDHSKLAAELTTAREEREAMNTVRFKLMTNTETLKKAQEKERELEEDKINLRSRIVDLELENAKLGASLKAAKKTSQKDMEKLLLDLDTAKEDSETINIGSTKLLEENKQFMNEIAELDSRINVLKAERKANAATIEKQGKELAASREEASRLAGVESGSQVTEQRIAEMEEHMRTCVVANKPPEFWDHWRKVTSDISASLAEDQEKRCLLAENLDEPHRC